MATLPRQAPKTALTGELVRVHQAAVWRYLRFLGCDAASADDLLQDTFLAMLRNPPRATEHAAIARWLRTTATRLFQNSGRRTRNDLPLDEAAIEAAWTTFVRDDDSDQASDDVDACMQSLPDRMRKALLLRYAKGGDRNAVAQAMGLQDEGAKTLLRRARERLARCLEHRRDR